MATPSVDYSTELTPSLDWLNSATPMPLLGITGITDNDRQAARKARLKRWTGEYHHPLRCALAQAFEAEPSVTSFATAVPMDVGDAADTVIHGLPSGDVGPEEWSETCGGVQSAIAGLLEPWAEAPVRAIVRNHLHEGRLAAVADHFHERESRIADAYRAANERPLVAETPWDRWDLRRSIFDHVVMLQACKGRHLPAIVGSVEATRLAWELQPLFAEASAEDFADAMLHAVRFGVGHFRLLREGVVEVPGIGFEVALDHNALIVAASPGRVEIYRLVDGGIRLICPGATMPVDIASAEEITARSLTRKLAMAGIPAERKLIAKCLQAGLWDRIRTAAAAGGLHGC